MALRRLLLRPREISPEFSPFERLSSPLTTQVAVVISALFSFITLTAATLSTPISTSLYFLRTNQERGLTFGLWGWCQDHDGICTAARLGYTRPPQLPSTLTVALILYPIASLFVLAFMASYIPILRGLDTPAQVQIAPCLGLISTLISILSFGFMLAIFSNAAREFSDKGYSTEYGPFPALSLLSVFLLSLATLLSFQNQPAEPKKTTPPDLEQHLTPTKPRRARASRVAFPKHLHRL